MKLPATLRFAGHPLHPALVHLPIGAWIAVVAWDVAALVAGGPGWWRAAYVTLALGLVAAVPAAAAGFVDYLGIPNGHRAEKTAIYHLTAMLAAATAYLVSFLVRGADAPPDGGARIVALALDAAGLALLVVGGWLGGDLVYRHRVGLRDEPEEPSR